MLTIKCKLPLLVTRQQDSEFIIQFRVLNNMRQESKGCGILQDIVSFLRWVLNIYEKLPFLLGVFDSIHIRYFMRTMLMATQYFCYKNVQYFYFSVENVVRASFFNAFKYTNLKKKCGIVLLGLQNFRVLPKIKCWQRCNSIINFFYNQKCDQED